MASKEATIFRLHLKEALLAAQKGEGELAILYQEVANDVTAKVRAAGDQISAVQLEGEINEAFEKVAFKRVKIVRASIENAAKLGPKASKKTMRAVYGDEVAKAQVRSSKKALNEAAERIAGRTTVDGVSLGKRMRKVDKQISGEIAREVQTGIQQKKGILGAARQIEKLDPRDVRLPKYLQRVEAAARSGNIDGLKKLTSTYSRYAEGLGEIQPDLTKKASKYSLRSATQRFLKDIEKTGQDGVDGVVARYVKDKAAFRANLIARHETVEAFRRSYIEQSKNKPGVIGMQWRVSPTRHPVADECDVYANQNAYKMGPGVYPVDKVPRDPHPACLCSVTVVLDKHHFQRQQADNDNAVPPLPHDVKSPDALGWLQANEEAAAKILGPTRHALMKQGVNVLDSQGKPLLVRDLLGAQRQKMAVGAPPVPPPVAPKKAPKPAPVPKKKVAPAPKPVEVERPKSVPPPPPPPAPKPVSVPVPVPKPVPAPKPPPPPPAPSPTLEARKAVRVPVPKYGVAHPEAMMGVIETDDLTKEAFATMKRDPLDQNTAVGPVPDALLAFTKAQQRKIAEHFGLPVPQPLRIMEGQDAVRCERAAGTALTDGTVQLRLQASYRADYRVIVHELIHTLGGAVGDGGRIRGLEEAATEELAQVFLGHKRTITRPVPKLDLSGVKAGAEGDRALTSAYERWQAEHKKGSSFRSSGTYRSYRDLVFSAVQAATGEDVEQLHDRVVKAFVDWKQTVHVNVTTYEKHQTRTMNKFIDALEPTPEQRRFYEKVFHTEDNWENP